MNVTEFIAVCNRTVAALDIEIPSRLSDFARSMENCERMLVVRPNLDNFYTGALELA